MCQVRPLRPLAPFSPQQHILTLIIHSGALLLLTLLPPPPFDSLRCTHNGNGRAAFHVCCFPGSNTCVSKKVFLSLFFLCTYCLGRPSFFMKRLYPLCPFPKGARMAGSKRDLEKIVQSGMIAVKQQRQKPLTQKAGRAFLGRRSGETDGTK